MREFTKNWLLRARHTLQRELQTRKVHTLDYRGLAQETAIKEDTREPRLIHTKRLLGVRQTGREDCRQGNKFTHSTTEEGK